MLKSVSAAAAVAAISVSVVVLVGPVVLRFAPETKGKPLPE